MPHPTSLREALIQLRQYIFLSNVLYTIGPILTYCILDQFSYENSLYFPQRNVLSYAVSFDGLHYLNNHYLWEKNYAFLPGYVSFIRIIEGLLEMLTTSTNVNALLVLLLVVANKVLTALSAAYLYRLASNITNNPRIGRAAATLFLFNPASIFYHSVYSEPLYCYLTFMAIHTLVQRKIAWMKHLDQPVNFFKNCLSSLTLAGVAVGIRTTAMFLSLIPGIPLLAAFGSNLLQLKLSKVFRIGVTGATTLLIFASIFGVYLYYGYWQFCSEDEQSWFCSDPLPNVYGAVQEKFWQVGFLKYYAAQRAVMIIFGSFSMLCAVGTAFNTIWKKQFELCCSYWLLLFVTICYSNVQSSARFFSSHPMYSINLALFLTQKSRGRHTLAQGAILYYLIFYNVAGIIFFPIRFPWT